MKIIYVIKSQNQVIGAFSNFKKFFELLDDKEHHQHYATIMLSLRMKGKYCLDDCVCDGRMYPDVRIEKITVNILHAPIICDIY
jgi:hypothetical protein